MQSNKAASHEREPSPFRRPKKLGIPDNLSTVFHSGATRDITSVERDPRFESPSAIHEPSVVKTITDYVSEIVYPTQERTCRSRRLNNREAAGAQLKSMVTSRVQVISHD